MSMSRRELLIEMGLEEAIVFESPDYDDAIVGYDVCSERVVYDYDVMVESLMGQTIWTLMMLSTLSSTTQSGRVPTLEKEHRSS